MIFLELFLTFLKIGAVAFGGGYGMIPLIRDDCIAMGWLTESEILNFIAVAESTPGPIAVNMATFVGSSQGGVLGAALATLGVVLPAFLIIVLVVTVLANLLKYAGVKAALGGIKPAVAALILGTAITMLLSLIFGVRSVHDVISVDLIGLVILALVAAISLVFSKVIKKPLSPIFLIILSGILGVVLYGV